MSRASSFASNISLNVGLASARPVRIPKVLTDLHLVSDIDLHLQGTLASPVAVGNIYFQAVTPSFAVIVTR